MAATVVSVWNLAFSRFGQLANIQSEIEDSEDANTARVVWEPARDMVLAAFPWNFARKFQTLALSGTAPTEWDYQYVYPSDCIRALRLVTGDRFLSDPLPFQIGWNTASSRFIWTDTKEAELEYTAMVSDLGAWEPQAIHALSWLLGSELAYAVTQNRNLRTELFQLYGSIISAAWAANLNEGQPDKIRDAESIRVR